MITRDLAAKLSVLLVEEAPAGAVGPVMEWMQVLLHGGGQSALDVVESEAKARAGDLFEGEGIVEVGVVTRAFYRKIARLALTAQADFEREQAELRRARKA